MAKSPPALPRLDRRQQLRRRITNRRRRFGTDDAGNVYSPLQYGSDLQQTAGSYRAAIDTARRSYRLDRSISAARTQMRTSSAELQHVRSVGDAYVDWTANVERARRDFTVAAAAQQTLRRTTIAALDAGYWQLEAASFAAQTGQLSSQLGLPWSTRTAAMETAEADWTVSVSGARLNLEQRTAAALEQETIARADALQERNTRQAAALAERDLRIAQHERADHSRSALTHFAAIFEGHHLPAVPRYPGDPLPPQGHGNDDGYGDDGYDGYRRQPSARGHRRPGSGQHCPSSSAIYLFMSGGPSQMDLFNYKPVLNQQNGRELLESVRRGLRLAERGVRFIQLFHKGWQPAVRGFQHCGPPPMASTLLALRVFRRVRQGCGTAHSHAGSLQESARFLRVRSRPQRWPAAWARFRR